MGYRKKMILTFVLDSLFILAAIFLSSVLLYEFTFLAGSLFFITFMMNLFAFYIFSFAYRLHKKTWKYAGMKEMLTILKTAGFTILVTAVFQQLLMDVITYRILIAAFFFQVVFIGSSRLCWRLAKDNFIKSYADKKRTMVVGAGSAGTMVVRQLQQNRHCELIPVTFADDDVTKHHVEIYNIPVAGSIKDIPKIAKAYQIENIVVALPSIDKRRLNEIFQECVKTKVKTQVLPMLEDLVTGKRSVSQCRDVEAEDLLERDPIALDYEAIETSITDKVVLVTGAGGSIGSEICRQVFRFKPDQLILLGHGENSIYTIEMELLEMYEGQRVEIVTEIADIQDAGKISTIMNYYKPDVVYHAAAHKHVPLMERNPEEAIKNNVIGTRNVAEASSSSGVGSFVMVSSDKAVHATSVMGASKRLAEMVVQHMNKESTTSFNVVRFGNVLESRGSVIPLFKKQIQKGGPVTVTHPDMVRYFMTIPEASSLVIQAGSLAKGGEIFVLDMGQPVKIIDLAKNLIKLSGHSIDDIGIKFTGIRHGEKLYEEILSKNEVHNQQIHPKIYVGTSSNTFITEIEEIVKIYPLHDKESLREKLLELANRDSTTTRKEDVILSAEA
ncbi:polysaccharide biosynthesis protein [Salibacterium salarium]|uniref:Polysaccharide biosynthesis protein n=1 Tax=Salibacterium salarium TaxID=284579 RepID=A0A3R9P055_9BACI|nr:nucleoside-diphosphate sugar epimerase/dehydratase [Salibacterium salarium]RSL29997.1 polysaccharide biosynthesis protein [Salibacterium salarium]